MTEAQRLVSLQWVLGGGFLDIGPAGELHVDFPAVLTGWSLLADTNGDLVLDIRRAPLDSDAEPLSICGSTPPSILVDCKGKSDDLTGWATRLDADDVLSFQVLAVSQIRRATLGLRLRRL
jgi:hypothetical protein